jgi:hypothetical protein
MFSANSTKKRALLAPAAIAALIAASILRSSSKVGAA